MQPFDPYHIWLAIPPEFRPPNYYQLLGLQMFEQDVDVIINAADQRMAHVKSFANGPYGVQSQKLLNEISQAKLNLIHPERRASYNAGLESAAVAPTLTAPPLAADSVVLAMDEVRLAETPDQEIPTEQAIKELSDREQPITLDPALNPTLDSVTEVPVSVTEPRFQQESLATRFQRRRRDSSMNAILITAFVSSIIGALVLLTLFGGNDAEPEPTVAVGPTADAPSDATKTSDSSPSRERPRTTRPSASPPPPRLHPDDASEPDATVPPSPMEQVKRIDKDPVADAIGGIAPRAEDPPKRPITSPVDKIPSTNPLPTAIATKPTEPGENVSPDFNASLGRAFRELVSDRYAEFETLRIAAKRAAEESEDSRAINAAERLEQMGFAFGKIWELVGISIGSLAGMQEISTPGGAMAAVVEASPNKLVLQAAGQQRVYLAEQRGPITVFPEMSHRLTLLLADRVERKSPQAKKAISFVTELADTNWPQDDAEMWGAVTNIWHKGGVPDADFFVPPTPQSEQPITTTDTTIDAGSNQDPSLASKPNTGPGYHVVKFRFDGKVVRESIPIPADTPKPVQVEINRIHLGNTLGIHAPDQNNRQLRSGTTWTVEGPFLKLAVRVNQADDQLQLTLGGQYRRTIRPAFRFEPISLSKMDGQYTNILSALEKRGVTVVRLIDETLNGGGPLDGIEAVASDDLSTVLRRIGELPETVDPQLEMAMRLQQIRAFAGELQEDGWIELKFSDPQE